MRILVGLSGGLDSTYAALKLKGEGHCIEGAVVLMHEYTDISSAEDTANALGIKLNIIDARDAFEGIKNNFVNEYINARTPNPCIICNPCIKFRYLADYASENGFDKIATGHYSDVVRVKTKDGERFTLSRSRDQKKDQTYMLYRLPQDILSMLVLPLADEIKTDIRARAEAIGLVSAHKKDSQEICFIPNGDYAAYIESCVGSLPKGDFVDTDGNVLGKHNGIIRYTVGQRKGLGISLGERAFVTGIDPVSNTVTLSASASLTENVYVEDLVFSSIAPPTDSDIRMRLKVKLRYHSEPQDATVIFMASGGAEVILDAPARSVTPGQSAVMYDGDLLVAGGFIK